jgi:uncharacterized protein YbaR (Trm112 family)
MAEHATGEAHGCERCWPHEAVAAWGARQGLTKVADLVDESHYHVMILSCPYCRQNFLSVFTETVDWADGEDPQYWKVVPIEPGEVAILTDATGLLSEADLDAMARDRRCLRRDYPKGASAPTVGWSVGLRIGPHD